MLAFALGLDTDFFASGFDFPAGFAAAALAAEAFAAGTFAAGLLADVFTAVDLAPFVLEAGVDEAVLVDEDFDFLPPPKALSQPFAYFSVEPTRVIVMLPSLESKWFHQLCNIAMRRRRSRAIPGKSSFIDSTFGRPFRLSFNR